ncbi:hypothetical protein [Novosphingobium resinovorum]|uniref:hypothetical protein n=1 Tax=Novosphingobium resinovorum TaxID=158500 RepID=UPI002ED1C23E|nr:hypothetical protein [Novosphingobium resinovorum]
MRPGLPFAVLIAAVAAATAACAHGRPAESAGAVPDIDPGQTASLLSAVLDSQEGHAGVSAEGPCPKAGPASTVRDDLVYFLGELRDHSRITSQCQVRGGERECDLVLGRAVPKSEEVWTRTYTIRQDVASGRVLAPIACYSIP